MLKITTEAEGKAWSEATSAAKDYKAPTLNSSSSPNLATGRNSPLSSVSSKGINSMDDLESFLGKSK